MRKWLCVLGGCLVGYLVKKKVDNLIKTNQIKDWPSGVQYDMDAEEGRTVKDSGKSDDS